MVRKGLTDIRRLSFAVTSGSHARAVTGVVTVELYRGNICLLLDTYIPCGRKYW